jgi:transcription elongation factor Elf1
MIIFGISTKEKAKSAGTFACPACGKHARFAKIVRSRRFTLFFIPIIPLGSSDTGRVICQNCGSEYSENVLANAA